MKREIFFLLVIRFPDCKLSRSISVPGTILDKASIKLPYPLLHQKDNTAYFEMSLQSITPDWSMNMRSSDWASRRSALLVSAWSSSSTRRIHVFSTQSLSCRTTVSRGPGEEVANFDEI